MVELDVCTDVVLVVTVVGRPELNTLAAGLLKIEPPPVAAVVVPVPEGAVPAKPVPDGVPVAGMTGTGPGAVEPGAGAPSAA